MDFCGFAHMDDVYMKRVYMCMYENNMSTSLAYTYSYIRWCYGDDDIFVLLQK